ncbi:hypothetical protein RUND412_007201 [Rhizina undulata]
MSTSIATIVSSGTPSTSWESMDSTSTPVDAAALFATLKVLEERINEKFKNGSEDKHEDRVPELGALRKVE